MLSAETISSHASPRARNPTCLHEPSTNQLPYGELSIDSSNGASGCSIDAPPASTFKLSHKSTSCLNSDPETNASVNHPIHRRAKTETPSLPSIGLCSDRNEYSNCFEEVNLEPITEQTPRQPKSGRPGTLFAGLFRGESAPVRFGLVRSSYTEETSANNTDYQSDIPTRMTESPSFRPQSKFSKRMTMPSPLKQVSSTARFSLFSSKTPSQGSKQIQLPEPADDELLNLDINSALFPTSSADLPTPEAIKSLQYNAERVIGQLQAAYKMRTFALHEAIVEKSSLAEELDETQSRLLNIKNQLNGMAEKVHEQDKAMKAMAEELKLERQKRQEVEEEAVLKRSIARVREPEPAHYHQDHSYHHSCNCAREKARDGLETKSINRQNKRSSGATFYSDSGFESGDESTAESVFSQKYDNLGSPATLATRGSGASSPDVSFSITPLPSLSEDQLAPPPQSLPAAPSKPSAPSRKPSAYDRVLRGISSTNLGGSFMSSNPFSTSRCSNCHGATASEAWSVVSVLKDENSGLKNRIVELETAVDECITLVGG
ncbi:hypothetical protein ACJ72_04279 [Emergomyces africanus]|uniref:Uncharacterized protein n=1 Tax=Emergomyces africanus TaxID=1955775 RepID=A0A1B7NXN9_9EURO|nr:hypothetical protein ACJ72_04279 [Emergomyces africanus]